MGDMRKVYGTGYPYQGKNSLGNYQSAGNSGGWNNGGSGGWSGGNSGNSGGWSGGNSGGWSNGNSGGWNNGNSGNSGGWNNGNSGGPGGWNNSGGQWNQPGNSGGGYPGPGNYPGGGSNKGGPSKEIIIAIVVAVLALCLLGVAAKLVLDNKSKSETQETTTEKKADKESEQTEASSDTQETTVETQSGTTAASTAQTYSGTTAAQSSAPNNYYIIPDSNSRYLTASDLAGMSATQLSRARNEIYARHGRRFKKKALQSYFDSQAWYSGTIAADDFDESVLNSYEQYNISFIKQYENGGGTSSGSSSSYSSEYVFPDSSSRKLTASDMSGKSSWQLRCGRNEIYARHGRLFNDSDLQNYFNSKSWYNGYISPDNFSESVLSATEKYNIDFIKSYE